MNALSLSELTRDLRLVAMAGSRLIEDIDSSIEEDVLIAYEMAEIR